MMMQMSAALASAACLIILDTLAKPTEGKGRRLSSLPGLAILINAAFFLFGSLLALTGSWLAALCLTLLSAGILTLVSNIKRQVLGEPLVFSDFALIRAIFQHPQFYLSALTPVQLVVLGCGFLLLIGMGVQFSTGELGVRAIGLVTSAAAILVLWALAQLTELRELRRNPDLERDVSRHGLIATLVVYWYHWRRQPSYLGCREPRIPSKTNELVVIVQCESFADPAELFGDPALALPGLARAKTMACNSGRLLVSGFGAYTMRTEFGVLFGIGERQLGLHKFDPFLTGTGYASWALPNRLAREDWVTHFVHPHDMRFYGRDKLMPEAGFDTLNDEGTLPPPGPDAGRYATDQAVCDKILELAQSSDRSCMIYAVTIENHGPWSASAGPGANSGREAYLRLVRNSDDMLARLLDELCRLKRPVILCFFGDHRPSIPNHSEPGDQKHTPFVVVRFDENGRPMRSGEASGDMTPALLHHEVLAAVRSGTGQS